MRIGLDEIDPNVAHQALERLSAPAHSFLLEDIHWSGPFNFKFDWQAATGGPRVRVKRPPTDDERSAFAMAQKRVERQTVWGIGIPALVSSGAFVASMVLHGVVGGGVVVAGLVGCVLAGTGAGVMAVNRFGAKSSLQRSMTPVEMRAVFPLLSLTRAERIYCDTCIMLATMEVSATAESTIRDTLRQLNNLVQSSRQLDVRRKSLLPILGSNSLAELERERAQLALRLSQASDHTVRNSIEQSLRMCDTRIENARAVENGMERIKAQQEAITHTLSTAQTSIARMQLIAQPQTELAAQEIADTVSNMNQQTYAVEQAVQEVMQMRV